MLDIGANLGVFSIVLCAFKPNLKIIAFEPIPMTFQLAKFNIFRAGFADRVTLLNRAVSSDNGKLQIAYYFENPGVYN